NGIGNLYELLFMKMLKILPATMDWTFGTAGSAVLTVVTEDVSEQMHYLFRTADILADRLDRPEEAIGAVQQARATQPDSVEAIERLDALLTQTEQWDDLASLLDGLIGQADDGDAIALMVRRAQLTESRLEDPNEAIDRYGDILALSPDEAAVIEALERLFDDPDFAGQVAPLLQPVYEQRDDWQRLIGVFQVRVETSDTAQEKVSWYEKIADLYEHKGETAELAFENYLAAAVVDPGRKRTLEELLRLADQLSCHTELVSHMQALVEEIDDDQRRRETHRILAGLCSERTGDSTGAETHLRALLDIDSGDMQAVDDLTSLYRSTDNKPRLVDMLLAKASLVEDKAVGNALFAEAGALCSADLDAPERAIEIYETLQRRDSDGDTALDALEGLYERVEAWEPLVDIYRQKISRTVELDGRKGLAGQMARIQADQLEAIDEAIQTWRMVLSWDEEDVHAMRQLDELFVAGEDWYGLQDILGRLQSLVGDEEWTEAQYRLAKLYESDDQLADVRQAIETHRALLERDPGHEDTISSLEALIEERDERDEAFAVLRPVLSSQGAWERLWVQYEVLADKATDDPQLLLGILHDMSALADGELADPERAYAVLDRAFRTDPRHQNTVVKIESLSKRESLLESLVGLYHEIAEDTDDDLALTLRLRTGGFLMGPLEDPERAIDVYRTIREDHPDHLEALDCLARLYRDQGMAPELSAILQCQIDVHHTPDDKIALLADLGRVKEQQLEDRQGAYETYAEILDIDRGSDLAIDNLHRLAGMGVQRLDIAERLEPIYTERADWHSLHSLLELKLEAVTDETDRVEFSRQLAELNLHQLDRKPEAIDWFGRALRLDPEDTFLLEQLSTLTAETGLWSVLRGILMDAAEVSEEDRKLELWSQAADINRV
ncbi:MAG: hypothetical protein QF464_07495, partial [Myxococcota bacterium]|nr:hypothetical protein [Myxococcota bacterium]